MARRLAALTERAESGLRTSFFSTARARGDLGTRVKDSLEVRAARARILKGP